MMPLGGCAGGTHAARTQAAVPLGSPPPNVVSEGQIAAYPADSPARSLLELWQAVEFSDVEGARHLIVPSALAGRSSAHFAQMVEAIGDNLPGLQVLNINHFGLDASVRAYLVFYAASGKVSADSPMAFQFRRFGGHYQLSDLSYFLHREQEIASSQRRAARQ